MFSFFNKLKSSVSKTKDSVFSKLGHILTSSRTIDDSLMEEIEEILLSGDIGVKTSHMILNNLKKTAIKNGYKNSDQLYSLLKLEIETIVNSVPKKEIPLTKPHVLIVIGVNGVGKTTSIGKLTKRLKEQGKSVLLVAADTFRAAASEQLTMWAERNKVDIVKHKANADPSAVAYDGVSAAVARGVDIVIIDTAGRLHNKTHLMEQLAKMDRTIKKVIPNAPHETLLVLDATMGQNAISQAKAFTEICPLDGIILSKLDGTAKGGVVIGISHELKIPIKYVGIGEGIDDLDEFDSKAFIAGIFE